jgi:hypothetical protein
MTIGETGISCKDRSSLCRSSAASPFIDHATGSFKEIAKKNWV